MLQNIHVKNIALIKEIDIDFSDGLNVVTGETGAGKSLILGSVAMGVGLNSSKEIVTEGESEALIELTFSVHSKEVKKILKDNDIELDDDIIILQRKINKNRITNRINFQSVSLSLLKEVGAKLIQIHGQHDNQLLLNKKEHTRLLDCYGGIELIALLDEYRIGYNKLSKIEKDITQLEITRDNRARDIDYFEYVIEEIDQAGLQVGEDAELRDEYKHLIAIRNSSDDINRAYGAISDVGYDAVSDALSYMQKTVNADKAFGDIYSQLVEVEILLSDIVSDLSSIKDDYCFDQERFDIIDERIDLLDSLKKKYGTTLEDVIKFRDEIEEKLEISKNSVTLLKKLYTDREELLLELNSKALSIRKKRKEACKKMEEKMSEILEELNFQQVRFKVVLEELTYLGENGLDSIELYISTNVGYDLKPLSKVASGGELSRIMLAIQSIISDLYVVDSMIFDEIDAGISGKTATMVAKRLKEMSENKQIICVTHLAQIAAVGDTHFKIDKLTDNGVTTTQLEKLNEEKSVEEVARLLSGIELTETTIQNARELKELFS